MIYTIRAGDTLSNIASNYNLTYEQLASINGITDPNNISVGQNLFIPNDIATTHTVKAGETLYSISRMHGIPLQTLINANKQITNPNRINIGDVINLPDTRRVVEANGYAVANINTRVLDKTLPYLTYLSLFSYQVKADGTLYTLYEDALINSARQSSVAPVMVVTNISSDGFDSDLAHTILTNDNIQNTLVNNIISTLIAKNYYGVDIDFEYLYPEDRVNYLNFLRKLKTQLQANNLYLSVAVAPKYRDNQSGLLYEAHDYRGIGEIADRVIIMTYEWGYIYGEPRAISPLREVEAVISYAVTRIPSEKILMGMPNYAYNWTLPFTQGSSATVLTNVQAVNLAFERGATINFDTSEYAPYFNYVDDDGKEHVVWFDDARSIDARLDLVTKYNLAGVSYWTINNYSAINYSILNNKFQIKKVL